MGRSKGKENWINGGGGVMPLIICPKSTFIAHLKWGFGVNRKWDGFVWGLQLILSRLPGRIGKCFNDKYVSKL